ncbi:lipoprotein-releasing ABC transporter permease subunit [Fodinicurvata sp. EGI_FJ10296]|uniref:lipoprotein-releasing ABC transporter permease subunit n=1 Tax=Fodinicurvata sp. EGI_FJ10296 TaxID=3231908 RepID=UPI0034520587
MIFNPFERLVAFRYLRARRKEGFISIIAGFSFLGIALGVATLIIVMSVMNGFRAELVSRVLGMNGHLSVYSTSGDMNGYEAVREELLTLDPIVNVTPAIEGQGLVSANEQAAGAAIRGVLPEDFLSRPAIADSIVTADGLAFEGEDVIAIGSRMANRFAIRLGDDLTVTTPQGRATAMGTMPRSRAYTVGAIYDTGMYEYDSSFVFMPLTAAQILFQKRDQVTHLEVFTQDPENLIPARQAIQEVFDGRVRVFDWQQANSSFFSALEVERNVMFLILTLIIIVAAFNVISGLVMLVKDKGRDIAILRTMGATQGMVMRIFLLTGASIGVFGTLAGAVLGIAFAENIEPIRQGLQTVLGRELFQAEIYFLSQLPSRTDWMQVGSVVGMAIGLSFLATLYPSWRAARLDPVEALRYE